MEVVMWWRLPPPRGTNMFDSLIKFKNVWSEFLWYLNYSTSFNTTLLLDKGGKKGEDLERAQ